MKHLLTWMLLIVGSASILAQGKDVPFHKDFFKDQKDGLKEAQKAIKAADEHWVTALELSTYYSQDGGIENKFEGHGWAPLRKAYENYELAQKFNPNNSELNYKLGICYMNATFKEKCLDRFLKAYELDPTRNESIHYYLGQGYQYNYKFDKAIYEYGLHRNTLDQGKQAKEIFWVNKKIEECRFGQKMVKTPERVWIDNLGKSINTKFPEYSAFISTDESIMLFTARRDNTIGLGIDDQDQKYYEDVYISSKDKDGQWTLSQNMGENINTEGHDASAGIAPDGKTLFVYNDKERKSGGDIFLTTYEGGEWTKLRSVGDNINTKGNRESSACLSFDGKILYFVSDKPGGIGGRDIYTSDWDEEKEEWKEPKNLGLTINTPYDEEGVFIHPDGQTLYFASKGHGTMGGYDIFYTMLNDGKWSIPKNIGYPINTPDNDVFFVTSANGRYGYMSSARLDGEGDLDIYRVTFLGPPKKPLLSNEDNLLASIAEPIKERTIEPKVAVRSSRLAMLKGIIRDDKTKEPLEATIDLIDNDANKTLATFKSDPTTGKYLVSLPAGKNYGIAVRKEGYLFHSENFNIPDSAGYRTYERNVDLKRIEIGAVIVLRNIFYDYDKSTLRPESVNELERLIKLLNDNPTMRIELSSHTDTRGSDSYNQRLSEDRAKSVVTYLIKHGIAKGRLEFKGYGEKQLQITDAEISKLKTKTAKEEAHQQNRRTEFKIIGK